MHPSTERHAEAQVSLLSMSFIHEVAVGSASRQPITCVCSRRSRPFSWVNTGLLNQRPSSPTVPDPISASHLLTRGTSVYRVYPIALFLLRRRVVRLPDGPQLGQRCGATAAAAAGRRGLDGRTECQPGRNSRRAPPCHAISQGFADNGRIMLPTLLLQWASQTSVRSDVYSTLVDFVL